MGTPVLFRQHRPGCDGEVFTLVKFRSMRVATERVDRRGTAHVSRSLAALDQPRRAADAWSTCCAGTCSLVGPRPLLVEYLDRYSPRQAPQARGAAGHHRPGPGGGAQQRALVTDGCELDVEYVDRRSLKLDVQI